ncbi:Uncharacterised protein [Mycobacterium tuberculosis]|nr:Uncharacterised protein [Mycobacterium tuberculosis]
MISPADRPYFAGSPRTSSTDVRYRVAMSRTRFRSRVITAMLASLRALTGTPLRLPICSGCSAIRRCRSSDVSDVHHRCTSGAPVPGGGI